MQDATLPVRYINVIEDGSAKNHHTLMRKFSEFDISTGSKDVMVLGGAIFYHIYKPNEEGGALPLLLPVISMTASPVSRACRVSQIASQVSRTSQVC